MRILRTPDEQFASLPGFPWAARHVTVPAEPDGDPGATVRVAYLDEGPTDAPLVLLLHGEPSWSFLWRTAIPPLLDAGLRVVAPDLVGFGRSDKPADQADYTYARHVEWMRAALLDELGLTGVTLVGHDWGGLIGLRLAAEHPDRFARIVVTNTMLPTGDHPMTGAFLTWREISQRMDPMRVGRIIGNGSASTLPDEVAAAYDAPFPDPTYTAGARVFPLLVPVTPDDPAAEANRRAWEVLRTWDKPFLTAFSDADPITAGGDRVFQERVPGAAGREHPTLAGGAHFLQEDVGARLGEIVAEFVAAS